MRNLTCILFTAIIAVSATMSGCGGGGGGSNDSTGAAAPAASSPTAASAPLAASGAPSASTPAQAAAPASAPANSGRSVDHAQRAAHHRCTNRDRHSEHAANQRDYLRSGYKHVPDDRQYPGGYGIAGITHPSRYFSMPYWVRE